MYKILVQKHMEDGKVYYLGTCKQVPWFLVEWNTKEEIHKLAPVIMKEFLSAKIERVAKIKNNQFIYSAT